jgi:hypothetical protein
MPDPQALNLWLEVDGHRYQNGSTATMVFCVAHLISYVSRFVSPATRGHYFDRDASRGRPWVETACLFD